MPHRRDREAEPPGPRRVARCHAETAPDGTARHGSRGSPGSRAAARRSIALPMPIRPRTPTACRCGPRSRGHRRVQAARRSRSARCRRRGRSPPAADGPRRSRDRLVQRRSSPAPSPGRRAATSRSPRRRPRADRRDRPRSGRPPPGTSTPAGSRSRSPRPSPSRRRREDPPRPNGLRSAPCAGMATRPRGLRSPWVSLREPPHPWGRDSTGRATRGRPACSIRQSEAAGGPRETRPAAFTARGRAGGFGKSQPIRRRAATACGAGSGWTCQRHASRRPDPPRSRTRCRRRCPGRSSTSHSGRGSTS